MKVKNTSKSDMVISTLEGKGYLIGGGKSIEVPGTIHPYYLKMQDLKVVEEQRKIIKESE